LIQQEHIVFLVLGPQIKKNQNVQPT